MELFGGDYDYLAGTNLGETHLKPGSARGDDGFKTAKEFYAYAREQLGDLYDEYDFEKLVPVTDENVDRESRRLASYGLFMNKGRFGALAVNLEFGKRRAEKAPGRKTYNYLFSRVAPHLPEDIGTPRDPDLLMSWHSNELWYTFASLRKGTPPKRPWEEKDFELADKISSYWANFIKTGDPNGEGLPRWEPFNTAPDRVMELGDAAAMTADPWQEIYKVIDKYQNE